MLGRIFELRNKKQIEKLRVVFVLLTFQRPFVEFIVEVVRHFQILVPNQFDSVMKTTHGLG
jgi:hypothetical protein